MANDKSSYCGIQNNGVNTYNPSGANPSSASISYAGSPYTFTALTSIGSVLPTVIGSYSSYAITPSLPAGLSFNSNTGEITGNPTFLISSGNFTVTANGSSGTQTCNLVVHVNLPGKRIFLTTNTTSGSWGSPSNADNFCNADSNKPTGVGIYKGMVGSTARKACNNAGGCTGFSNEAIDWVLAAGTKYYRPDGTLISVANADRIFTFPLTNPISTISTNVWTGIDAGWNTTNASTTECTSWTNAGFGNYGISNSNSSTSLNFSNASCGSSNRMYCVEQ